jgi:hypothetical protein
VAAAEIKEFALTPFLRQFFQLVPKNRPVPVIVPARRYAVKNFSQIISHFGKTLSRPGLCRL